MTQIDRRAFLAAAGAATAAPSAVGAQAMEPGWTPRAPLPWPVQEIYATALDDWRIVTAGGLVARQGQPLHIEDRLAFYDVWRDRWEEGPRLPAPRHHPMILADYSAVYAIGGYGRSDAGEWVNAAEAWMLVEGVWTPMAPLPSPQAEAVGIRLSGELHLITGRSPAGEANAAWRDQADTDRHLVYRVAEDRWETARPAPMARNSAAAALLQGSIWIAGGRTVEGGGTGRLDRYEPVEDRWYTHAPIPPSEASGRQVGGGLAMTAMQGRLIAFGGEWFAPGGGGVFAETWIYDPERDGWERGPDMRTPRHGLAAAALGGSLYAIAGGEVVSGGRAGAVVEAFRL